MIQDSNPELVLLLCYHVKYLVISHFWQLWHMITLERDSSGITPSPIILLSNVLQDIHKFIDILWWFQEQRKNFELIFFKFILCAESNNTLIQIFYQYDDSPDSNMFCVLHFLLPITNLALQQGLFVSDCARIHPMRVCGYSHKIERCKCDHC